MASILRAIAHMLPLQAFRGASPGLVGNDCEEAREYARSVGLDMPRDDRLAQFRKLTADAPTLHLHKRG